MTSEHFSAQALQCPRQGVPSPRPPRERIVLGDRAGRRAWSHVPANTTHICLIWHCSRTSCWHRIRKGRWGRRGRGRKGRGDYAQLFQKGECRGGGEGRWGGMRLRGGPGAGRGRKPAAVVVGTSTNRPPQQVRSLSQSPQALVMWLQQKIRHRARFGQECFITRPFDPSALSLPVSPPRFPNRLPCWVPLCTTRLSLSFPTSNVLFWFFLSKLTKTCFL